jgi:membrane peptidoglycan carboxypeptidase
MQAGSVFKAFTLAAAFEKGISPREYINSPQRKTFAPGDWGCGENFNQPKYTVNNSTGAGTFNMWSGAAMSINTFFVELERQAGLCRTVDIAERMGVKLGNGKPLLRYPSFTLGSMEVSPLSVAGAYATFANHGVYCKPHAVASISDLDGKTLYSDSGNCRRAVTREVADATTAILTGVIDGSGSRTGKDMSLGRDAAGKTGTTDSNAAVWFAGFTPDLAAAVWSGDPRGGFKHPMDNVTIGGRYYDEVHGSSIPGPIWRDAMDGALGDNAKSFDLQAKYDLKQARRGGYNGGDGGGNSYGGGYNRYYGR